MPSELKIEDIERNIHKVLEPNTLHYLTKLDVATTSYKIATHFQEKLEEGTRKEREPRDIVYASDLGKCYRQTWFAKWLPEKAEQPDGSARIKFLYGNILEETVLTLAKAAGYDVSNEQMVVTHASGKARGKIDAIINEHLVDVKSASSYSFKKYVREGINSTNDTFGYRFQVRAYKSWAPLNLVPIDNPGYIIFIDKQFGHIAPVKVEMSLKEVEEEINNVILHTNNPSHTPARVVGTKEGPIKGSTVLDVPCSYCAFKASCYGSGLRTYIYAAGPIHYVGGPYPKGVPYHEYKETTVSITTVSV